MARKEVVLVTGANGEVGHGLIGYLGQRGESEIVAIDIHPLDEELRPYCREVITGDILDKMLLGRLVFAYEIRTIYHLASILSTRAEFNPEAAHQVNVEGTLNLLRLAVEQSQWQGRSVKFLYPSSIAVYGLPDLGTKEREGRLKEWQWLRPLTMYGCNKLYCEHLGRYYANNYRQLARDRNPASVDFRCVRFPGLISAVTMPAGGTSDYAPEMIHHAAQGRPYRCFVRPDTRIPFMAMPDAIKALVDLEAAPRQNLSTDVYNVTSFSMTAVEIYQVVQQAFPDCRVEFEPDAPRQAIVDSWPADIDDSRARVDWGWQPAYDRDRAFAEYLIPNIRQRYASQIGMS
ncbi:MAG: NAD-dependent epimerase/dehydratase family protein [Chloroflexi bacterium]|nr:MAG: NAD-dependent epimerase/dehydratase family protein [Chloroflexota bacterium]